MRRCQYDRCGLPLPDDARPNQTYCRDRSCKQLAYKDRKKGKNGQVKNHKKKIPKIKKLEFRSEKYLEEYFEVHCHDFGWKFIGRQFVTDVGRIDLLVKDADGLLVIELKNQKSSDSVIGQIARYVGWVKENIAKGKPVNGLIITKKADKKLITAAKAFDNLEVKEFNIVVRLE